MLGCSFGVKILCFEVVRVIWCVVVMVEWFGVVSVICVFCVVIGLLLFMG